MKPKNMSWQQYSIYLLESLGMYNKDLEMHYYEKIKKFISWYEKNEGINLKDIPDEADKKEESMKKVISWRRIARAIERNDFCMKRLSFSENKSDFEKLKKMISKWDNLLNETTLSTDKDLRKAKEIILNERNQNESIRMQISTN